MRHLYLLFVVFMWSKSIFAQSVVSSAGSKSGILIGPNEDEDFAAITYNSGDDRFTFNYKLNKQDSVFKGKHPPVTGVNFEAGTTISKNQASFINEGKWKGGINLDFTLTRTWTNDKARGNYRDDPKHPGVKQFDAYIAQHTLYIRLSNSFSRINTFRIDRTIADSTFVIINDPLQNTFSVSPGFFSMHQWTSDWYFSWGVSANINHINQSTGKLSKTSLIPVSGQVYNAKDSSLVQLVGTQDTFYSGDTESEFLIAPRADVFIRYAIGESKPVVGFIASYSPIISTLSGLGTRNNFSFGPTFGLYTFPDQVVFALLNDFLQDKHGKYKYGLTFQASFPIKFK